MANSRLLWLSTRSLIFALFLYDAILKLNRRTPVDASPNMGWHTLPVLLLLAAGILFRLLPNDHELLPHLLKYPIRVAQPSLRSMHSQKKKKKYVCPRPTRWLSLSARTTPDPKLTPLLLLLLTESLRSLPLRLPRHHLILLPVLAILFEDGLLLMILTSST